MRKAERVCRFNTSVIFGFPVIVLQESHAAVRSAAICATVATGLYKDLISACKAWVSPGQVYVLNLNGQDLYEEGYANYRRLLQTGTGLEASIVLTDLDTSTLKSYQL